MGIAEKAGQGTDRLSLFHSRPPLLMPPSWAVHALPSPRPLLSALCSHSASLSLFFLLPPSLLSLLCCSCVLEAESIPWAWRQAEPSSVVRGADAEQLEEMFPELLLEGYDIQLHKFRRPL